MPEEQQGRDSRKIRDSLLRGFVFDCVVWARVRRNLTGREGVRGMPRPRSRRRPPAIGKCTASALSASAECWLHKDTHEHACVHAYIHTYIHANIHTYIHTCMHTCIHMHTLRPTHLCEIRGYAVARVPYKHSSSRRPFPPTSPFPP